MARALASVSRYVDDTPIRILGCANCIPTWYLVVGVIDGCFVISLMELGGSWSNFIDVLGKDNR